MVRACLATLLYCVSRVISFLTPIHALIWLTKWINFDLLTDVPLVVISLSRIIWAAFCGRGTDPLLSTAHHSRVGGSYHALIVPISCLGERMKRGVRIHVIDLWDSIDMGC